MFQDCVIGGAIHWAETLDREAGVCEGVVSLVWDSVFHLQSPLISEDGQWLGEWSVCQEMEVSSQPLFMSCCLWTHMHFIGTGQAYLCYLITTTIRSRSRDQRLFTDEVTDGQDWRFKVRKWDPGPGLYDSRLMLFCYTCLWTLRLFFSCITRPCPLCREDEWALSNNNSWAIRSIYS